MCHVVSFACALFLFECAHTCVRARACVHVLVRATETRLIKKKNLSPPFKQEFYRAVGYASIPAPQSTPQIRKPVASSGAPPPHQNTTSPTAGTTRESESERDFGGGAVPLHGLSRPRASPCDTGGAGGGTNLPASSSAPGTAAAPSSDLPTPPPPPPPPPPALPNLASSPPHDAAEWMEKWL
jgi:hypothetical protein